MGIAEAKLCYFIVYFSEADFYQEIQVSFDEKYWSEMLKPKLDRFYFNFYLPELYMKTKMIKANYFSFKDNDFYE